MYCLLWPLQNNGTVALQLDISGTVFLSSIVRYCMVIENHGIGKCHLRGHEIGKGFQERKCFLGILHKCSHIHDAHYFKLAIAGG